MARQGLTQVGGISKGPHRSGCSGPTASRTSNGILIALK